MSSPAIDLKAGRVYYGSYDNKVHAVDVNTGTSVWSLNTEGVVYASPALLRVKHQGTVKKAVAIGARDNQLYIADATTGEVLEKRDVGSYLTGVATPQGGRLYLSTNGGALIALE